MMEMADFKAIFIFIEITLCYSITILASRRLQSQECFIPHKHVITCQYTSPDLR